MNEVILESGPQAFGDGSHPSTRGVLEALALIDPAEFSPGSACDIGAGSGILSFAIHARFCCPVLAVDNSIQAIETLQENRTRLVLDSSAVAALNAEGFAHPVIAASAPFDLIVMNILPEPLLALAVAAERHLALGGVLILAGILMANEQTIINAYQHLELELTGRVLVGDWVTLIWQKEGV